MSEVSTEVLEEQGPIERHGRLRSLLSRRPGRVAMEATVEQITDVWEDDDEAALFGLEGDLVDHQELWEEHSSVVSDFLENKENEDLYQRIIDERLCLRGPGNREAVRRTTAMNPRDMHQFAAIFVTAGRISATRRHPFILADRMGGEDPVASVAQYKDDFSSAESKRQGLVSGFHQTPSAQELERRLSALQKRSKDTYNPIVKKENGMLRFVEQQIAGSPQNSVQLIETFSDCGESEARVEKSFAALLANDYLQRGEDSILGFALRIVEDAAAKGALTPRYVESRLAENDGDNMLSFFARAFSEAGLPTTVAQFMADKRAYWPPELTDGYQRYAEGVVNAYKVAVKRQSERSLKKAWLSPDLHVYEDDISRLSRKLHGRYEQAELNKPRPKQPKGNRLKLASSDVLAVDRNQEKGQSQPLRLATLSHSNDGFVIRAYDDVDTLLGQLLDRDLKRDPAFMKDMRKIVESLQDDPYGSGGVHSLQGNHTLVEIAGKQRRLYRAGARWMRLNVAQRVKAARVIFTTAEDELLIYAIPGDHDKYKKVLADLG